MKSATETAQLGHCKLNSKSDASVNKPRISATSPGMKGPSNMSTQNGMQSILFPQMSKIISQKETKQEPNHRRGIAITSGNLEIVGAGNLADSSTKSLPSVDAFVVSMI